MKSTTTEQDINLYLLLVKSIKEAESRLSKAYPSTVARCESSKDMSGYGDYYEVFWRPGLFLGGTPAVSLREDLLILVANMLPRLVKALDAAVLADKKKMKDAEVQRETQLMEAIQNARECVSDYSDGHGVLHQNPEGV